MVTNMRTKRGKKTSLQEWLFLQYEDSQRNAILLLRAVEQTINRTTTAHSQAYFTWEASTGEIGNVKERLGAFKGDPVINHDGVQGAASAVILRKHLAQQVLWKKS